MSRGVKVTILGRCDVRIGATRITAPHARCTFANDELTIRGVNGSSVYSFSSGTNVCNFINGSSFRGNTFCSNGIEVQFNGDQLVISGRAPRELIVCGTLVPLPESPRSATVDGEGVDFAIPPDHAVRSVSAGGMGRVVVDDDAAVDPVQFAVTASGTADVDLGRNTFGVLTVTASGTGCVAGAATCKIATLVASGTGGIRGVHATESMTAVCSGSETSRSPHPGARPSARTRRGWDPFQSKQSNASIISNARARRVHLSFTLPRSPRFGSRVCV